MGIVQFRWVNPNTNKVHIIDQFETDWRFKIGDNFNFWGGENHVQDVKIHFGNEHKNYLHVTQIVTILPLWEDTFGITPENLWGDRPYVGMFD